MLPHDVFVLATVTISLAANIASGAPPNSNSEDDYRQRMLADDEERAIDEGNVSAGNKRNDVQTRCRVAADMQTISRTYTYNMYEILLK